MRAVWLALALSLLWAHASLAQEPVGLIKTTRGEVSLLRQQTTQQAAPGMPLYVGDTLRTGSPPSAVAVTMIDETRVALGSTSRLVLHQFDYNPTTQTGRMRAELPQGTMAVQSGKLGSSEQATLAVTTPRSTVHIRDAQTAIKVKE